MLKRPQSAVTRLSSNIYNRVDEILPYQDSHKYMPDSFDHTNSTFNKFNNKIPILGMSDQNYTRQPQQNDHHLQNQYIYNQKNPQSYYDIEKQLHQASYSLKLNQVDEAIESYKTALSRAVHMIPSFQFLDLFGQVFKTLNAKAVIYIKERELKSSDIIIQTLLQWTQLQKGYEQTEFLSFIRCPLTYQAITLNTQSLQLLKVGKFNEGQAQLEKALDLLSSTKIEEPIHLLIGQTYLNYSSSLIYQSLYQEGMRIASTALTHLQQGLLQLQQEQDSSEITELISDAYINVAACKEKSKLYQEAHFHYYSALVNAQKYLPISKQTEINNIYDKFLSRQAGYLHQMTTVAKKHSRYPSKAPQQPFIETVKSMQESGNMISNAYLKRQRIILKEKRDYHKREQQSLNKFQPYTSLTKSIPSFNEVNLPKRIQKPKIITKTTKLKSETPKKSNERKDFIVKNYKKGPTHFSDQQIKMYDQDEIPPSTILRFLDNIINNSLHVQEHEVVLLEDFQDFRLSLLSVIFDLYLEWKSIQIYYDWQDEYIFIQSIRHMKRSKISIHKILIKSIKQSLKRYQFIIIGHSFNVSDVYNEIYSNKLQESDKIYATFLRELISEVCGQLSVNLYKQALTISQNQNQTDPKQILFFLNETNEYISIQSKNEYESLVFITQDPQMLTQRDEEIRPLVFKEYFSREDDEEEEEEIQPLIAIGKFKYGQDSQLKQGSNPVNQQQLRPLQINEQEVQEDDDDIQPLISSAQQGTINHNNYMEQRNNNDISESRDYEDEFQIYDIQEEVESQDKSASKNQNHQIYKNNGVVKGDKDLMDQHSKLQAQLTPINPQRQQRLSKQNSLPSQRMFGRKDQEMFTIKIESEDQISKEVIEVYADKKQNDLDVYQSMDQDMDLRVKKLYK